MKKSNRSKQKELQRFKSFLQSTFSNERIREGILYSYESKQGKTDAEIFYPRFVFAKNGALFCHLLSLLVALPYLLSQIFKTLKGGETSNANQLLQALFKDYNQILQPTFLVAISIALVLLLVLEYWKEEAANTFFNIYFLKSKRIAYGVLLWVLMLSAMSIFSSLCGGKEIVAVINAPDIETLTKLNKTVEEARALQLLHADRSNAIIKQRAEELKAAQDKQAQYLKETRGESQQSHNKMLLIVLFSEALFFLCKFTEHKYQFEVSQETENAFQENLAGKKKAKKKKRKSKHSKMKEEPIKPPLLVPVLNPAPVTVSKVKEVVPNIPKEAPPVLIEKEISPIEAKPVLETNQQMEIKTVNETAPKTAIETAPKTAIETSPQTVVEATPQTPVIEIPKDLELVPVQSVESEETSKKFWSKSNCNSLAAQYQKRIQQNEMGATFERVAQQVFFEYHHKHFDTLFPSGKMPQVSPAARYKWFATNYPEQAKQLPRTTRTLF